MRKSLRQKRLFIMIFFKCKFENCNSSLMLLKKKLKNIINWKQSFESSLQSKDGLIQHDFKNCLRSNKKKLKKSLHESKKNCSLNNHNQFFDKLKQQFRILYEIDKTSLHTLKKHIWKITRNTSKKSSKS